MTDLNAPRDDVRALLDLLAAQPGPQMHEVDPPTARQMMTTMGALFEAEAPAMSRQEQLAIPGAAGPIGARLYVPHDARLEGPLLTYFHGGGWVIGDLDTHDSLCAEIAHRTRLRVVSVDYRLAPEHRFPAATEDCVAAVRWLAGGPEPVGDVAAQIVAGDSAGGNLAAAVARELVDEVAIQAQWLIYPGVDMNARGGSLDEFAEGYLLTAQSMLWFMTHYLADDADRQHRWASPLNAQEWEALPPALVFTCGLDPLRDQGRAYAARLAETGHRVIFREAKGQLHGAMQMRKILPSAQQDLLDQLADLEALVA